MPPETPLPVLLCLPAMGVAASFYDRFADALTQSGCGLAQTMELRGHGQHDERASRGADFGYREIVEDDLPRSSRASSAAARCADLSRRPQPRRPVAVLASATLAHRLAGIVLIAAGTAHFRAWPADSACAPGSRCRPSASRRRCCRGTRDVAWASAATTRAADARLVVQRAHRPLPPRRQPARARGHRVGLRTVRLPVLSHRLYGDAVAPRGAQAELLAKLPSARIQRHEVAGVTGDTPWRRHFAWARRPDGRRRLHRRLARQLSRGAAEELAAKRRKRQRSDPRYAAICRACASVTPMSGIAVAGSMLCGARIQRTRLSALFGSRPTSSCGGPARPAAGRPASARPRCRGSGGRRCRRTGAAASCARSSCIALLQRLRIGGRDRRGSPGRLHACAPRVGPATLTAKAAYAAGDSSGSRSTKATTAHRSSSGRRSLPRRHAAHLDAVAHDPVQLARCASGAPRRPAARAAAACPWPIVAGATPGPPWHCTQWSR